MKRVRKFQPCFKTKKWNKMLVLSQEKLGQKRLVF